MLSLDTFSHPISLYHKRCYTRIQRLSYLTTSFTTFFAFLCKETFLKNLTVSGVQGNTTCTDGARIKQGRRSKIVKNIADANKPKNKFKLQTIKMCICNAQEGEESPKNTKKI